MLLRPVLLVSITVVLAVSVVTRGQDAGARDPGRAGDVRLLPSGGVICTVAGGGGSRIPGIGLNRFAVAGGPIKSAVPDPRS